MCDNPDLLKKFLIIPNIVSQCDNNFTENVVDYQSILTAVTSLRKDEYWDFFFLHKFEILNLKNAFNALSEEQKTDFFNFGIACLIEFVQCNFTGPKIEKQIEDYLTLEKFKLFPFDEKLSIDDEEISSLTKFPFLLFTAKIIFEHCVVSEIVNSWWQCRSVVIHQELIDDYCPALLTEIEDLTKKLLSIPNLEGHAKAHLHVELAHAHLLYRNLVQAKVHIDAAKEILGVKYNFIGVMGRRTRHQQEDVPQLTIQVEVNSNDQSRLHIKSTHVPQSIPLGEDNERYENIQFAEEGREEVMLTNLEQKLFLAILGETMAYSPSDQLRREQLEPFIEFILSQNSTYTVRLVALMLRCKIEFKDQRGKERALSQCEELVKCFEKETPHFIERVMDVFSSGARPIYKVEDLHANLLLNTGLVKEALKVFLKNELWEQTIICYTFLNLRHKAAEIIRKRLAESPTPRWWCLLGDATDDLKCYEKAWDLSKHRSHRAQTHWADRLYERKQYADAIRHYELAVGINPLQYKSWFRLGYASLQVENWVSASSAYRRCTTIEPDNFEAWNNLAHAYIKQENLQGAHHAISEALRCNYDNWKVWENFLVVSCDAGLHSDVMRAYNRLLDLKGKYFNIEVLNLLVHNVCRNLTDGTGSSGNSNLEQARELLGRVSLLYPREGYLWEIYGDIAPSPVIRAQRLQRAYNGYTEGPWDKTPGTSEQVLQLCNKLAETVLKDEFDPKNTIINSVKLSLSSAITAVKKQDWQETHALVDTVAANLEKVVEKIKTTLDKDC